ncbi:LamG-like jellyroll fold domain-containing protein [Snuella sedimenti]|uniref:T9SS type A sorting domain-containing protein n=1 Tax=Snuella sedimenti TaxID=2798802 RepID=A0A8J7IGN6_9FLAO|nr:LamG-like jellyroll fold domain-containing protein [Snuella sedimenti]MBJ6367006.1 T9SS type A sorting domain-containing protein [Snuella sedimenti]
MKTKFLFFVLLISSYYSFSQFITPQAYLTFEDNTIIPYGVTGITNVNASGTVNLANPAGIYSQTNNAIVNDAGENVLFKDFEGYLKFDETILNKNEFSLTAKYKWSGTNAWWLGLISFVGNDGTNYVDQHIQIKKPTGEINGLGLSAIDVLLQDQYHHIALTYNAGTIVLYIDGTQVATSTGQTIHNLTNLSLYLGLKTNVNASTGAVTPFVDGSGNSKNTKAYLDQVAIFNRALSSTEVTDVYNGELNLNHITVFPEQSKQTVTFGGDAKLTIKAWAEGNTSAISQKLYGDMNLKILRVPIFALQPITDPIYDNVITVINSVKSVNPNVKIFASIANGDGYGTDYHGSHKFPSSWQGCCPYNVYNLNLTTYAAYLDSFMDRMTAAGITIDYLGPWNEDAADDSDHFKVFDQMTKLGTTQRVGLERWALRTSVSDVDDVEDQIDITGSHFYDDVEGSSPIPEEERDDVWASLVNKSANPVWYTESTRYKTNDGITKLVNGMENIFPALRGGVESITFYQVCKRFVWANGGTQPIKYTGFQNIVNNSEGSVRPSTTDNKNIKVVAFANQDTLDVHIINKDTISQTVKLQLSGGYTTNGTIKRTIWTAIDTAAVNTYSLNGINKWNITAPAGSYSHLKISLNMSAAKQANNKGNNNAALSIEKEDNVQSLQGQNLKLFPNPAKNGRFTLMLPQKNNVNTVQVNLFNISGQLISSEIMDYKNRIDFHKNLAPNIYLLQTVIGTNSYMNKLVISN